MLVIFISPHSDPEAALGEPDAGGQCIYEYELGQALSEMPNTTVHIFCRQTYRRPKISRVNAHFFIHRIECGPAKFIRKEEIEPWLPAFAQQVEAVITTFSDKKILIHSHYWDGGKASLLLKQLHASRLPMVWTPHSLGSRKRPKFQGLANEQFYNFIPRLCWENYVGFIADKIIVSSPEEKKDVMHDYGIDDSRIRIVAPGINLSQFQPLDSSTARQAFELPPTGTILLSLGRLTRSKGYHHAIDALAALQEIYSGPVYLVICGGSSNSKTKEEANYLSELKQQVTTLGLEKWVIFKPAVPHDQINQLYSASNIVLVFSEHEPFGLTVIESMAMKRPVVAANAGGPLSLITQNQTGVLVNVAQPERSAYYIRSLIKDNELVHRIVSNAHEFVMKTFDWSVKAAEFRRTYQDVMTTSTNRLKPWTKQNFFLHHNISYPLSKSPYAVLH